MKKNDEIIANVVDYTHDGMGIIKIDNFPIFVEDVLVGEKIKVRITKLKKNLGFAKLIALLETSKNRVYGLEKTSGASLIHMSYAEQLKFKTNKIKNIMDKTVGKNIVNVLDTIGMDKPYHYRNKSVIPVQIKNNILKMGYYRPRSHEVVDSNECSIQYQEHNELSKKIKAILIEKNISIYNEVEHTGAIRHIMFRTNTNKTQIMVGIISKEKFANLDSLVDAIVKLDDRIKSVVLNINPKKTNVIFGDESITLYGKDYISDELDGIKFNISLRSFYQVNPIQTKVLYAKAIELANLSANHTIIDAYCGIGTISLFAARQVKQVYGIEVVDAAIENAINNAKENHINNAEFLLGKSEDKIKELISKNEKIDAVIVDPPRKGCEESFLQDLANLNINKIVYVSCNPASLARDIKILLALGYSVGDLQPVDMFPQTSEVEAVVLLHKNLR